MDIKPIETVYNGYRFRSRLEARWAVFLDAMGIEYLYEHEGFNLGEIGYYLPDFYLPEFKVYAEVKPEALTKDEFEKCWATPSGCLLFDGMPTQDRAYYLTGWDRENGVSVDEAYNHYASDDLYGRVVLQQSASKGRCWFLFGESIDDYWSDPEPEIFARQARFEHGETPLVGGYYVSHTDRV